ncbi:MAG: type II toxin-antitoxin system HicA family toxin [Phycisphaeraceae bacterium]
MKRRAFEKHLREHGCELDRHGANHDVWVNARTGLDSTLPRHREVKQPIVRAVCRQLGVPVPGKAS